MEDVAGYRVLRSAAHGDRARLLVGFAEGSTVVLKVTGTDDARAAVEIEALERAAGDHVVELLDVAADPDQTVLVFDRLAKGTLAELLERRTALDAGEAVTVLAPIASTLERLHAAGVAHTRLSLATICFAEDGAPTLTGFGAAELFATETPEVVRETVSGVLADRAGLRDIASIVLGRVAGPQAEAARRLAAEVGSATPNALADRLFALAPSIPVRFADDPGDIPAARVGMPRDEDAHDDVATPVLPPWLSALVPDWVTDRLQEPVTRLVAVWSGWPQRRRRLVVATVAGLLTVLGAVTLVPGAPARPPSVATPATGPAAGATPPSESGSDGLPEDPVEAVVLLLELRQRCVRDLSPLCLDDVAQPDSSAYTGDLALIRAIRAGGEFPGGTVVAGDPVLVERLGDAALIDLPAGSDPASVLLMRTADGWRIRDYLEAPAAPAGAPAGEPD